jgi:hypothetical protein
MDITRHASDTLTVIELELDEVLTFVRSDGRRQRITAVSSSAKIHQTDLPVPRQAKPGCHTVLRAHVQLDIDGVRVQLVRWIGCDRSFADPWHVAGLNVWFDGNIDLFDHLNESHGSCRPAKRVRLALWEEGRRMCPVLLHPWCPLPEDGLRITDCYDGDDCWLGPYQGADAHGGLDINHPAGTVLYAPFALQRQSFFDHISRGATNNRWRGECDWSDGSTWALQTHHLMQLLVPEHQPLLAGQPYATSAGMWVGSHEHTHFVWAVRGAGEDREIRLDPWLLMRQMIADRTAMTAHRRNGIIMGAAPTI